MMRSLNPAAFRRDSWFMRSRGASCLLRCSGLPFAATAADGWNGRGARILRLPPAHPKDRRTYGLSDAKTGVFCFAPVSQPRVERGREQADFWQVQQSPWAWAQLHAGSDRGGRAGSRHRDGFGPERVERDSGAGNYTADGPPVSEL